MINFYRILLVLLLFYPPILMVFHGSYNFYHSYKLIPAWFHDIEEKKLFRNHGIEKNITFDRNYFLQKNSLTYFSRNGEALHKISVDNQTIIIPKSDAYIIYTKGGNQIEFFKNQGEKQWMLDTFSFPIITDFRGNIVLFSSDHSTISIYDHNRNELLPKSYLGSLITDFSTCQLNDNIILGTMESDLYSYDFLGKLVFKKNFSKSKFNYIKSVACSSSGDTIAVISGLYPERITVLNNLGKTIWEHETKVERRTRVNVYIDESNKKIVELRENRLFVFSIDSGETIKTFFLNPKEFGKVKKIFAHSIKGWSIIAINGEFKNEVWLLNKNDYQVFLKKEFEDNYLNFVEIKEEEKDLFFSIHSDSSIYSYQLVL